jgi:hypothetical protein
MFRRSKNTLDALTLTLPPAADSARLVEHYFFDVITVKWNATVAGDAFTGSAYPWSSSVWTFTGTSRVRDVRYPGQMLFTYLGENAFRRDFELESHGHWVIYSLETCSRGLPTP